MLPVPVRTSRLAPWRDLWGVDDEFARLIRRFFGELAGEPAMTGCNVDVWEDDEHLYVEADMPGIKAEDLDVTLEAGMLTIRGKREEHKHEGARHVTEIRCGEFARSFSLPVSVDEEKVSAQLKDGILTITLDKKEEAKARKIKVQG